jgi:hypothetical protein
MNEIWAVSAIFIVLILAVMIFHVINRILYHIELMAGKHDEPDFACPAPTWSVTTTNEPVPPSKPLDRS